MSSGKKAVLLKVLLLGESSVGKTSIFRRYTKDEYTEEYKSTIGADFFSKDINIGNRDIIFQIWDTAGQERYKSLGQTFYRGSDACMLVYDICNQESYAALSVWVDQFLQGVGSEDNQVESSDLIFVVVGNKSDNVEGRQVDKADAEAFCNSRGFQYFETSAKTGENVSEAFQYIARKGVEKSEAQIEFRTAGDGVDLEIDDTDITPGAGACNC